MIVLRFLRQSRAIFDVIPLIIVDKTCSPSWMRWRMQGVTVEVARIMGEWAEVRVCVRDGCSNSD